MQHVTTGQMERYIVFATGADVRTVRRFLAGEQVKGAALRERLERAKAELQKAAASGEAIELNPLAGPKA